MHSLLTVLVFEVLCLAIVYAHPGRPVLPLCTQDRKGGAEINLQCVVFSDQFLDFNEVRDFTSSRPDNEKFSVTIECLNGGKVRLPWPFFAKNVKSLTVRRCTVVGMLSERNQVQAYPNELKQVVLSDIKNQVDLKDMYESIINVQEMSKDYDCGHTEAEVVILRNMESVFPPPAGSHEELLMLEALTSSLTIEKFLSHNRVCTYPNMKYLEESGSRSFSRFHFKIMESSQYPNLRVYSLRNNSLNRVPAELSNLRLDIFPSLSVLDLSDNEISLPKFEFSGSRKKVLVVNLRKNLVRRLGQTLLDNLVRSSNVLLDLRDNPLQCSCELSTYGNYLLSFPRSTAAHEIFNNISCEVEEGGVLKRRFLNEKYFKRAFCL